MTEMMWKALELAGCNLTQFDESNPRFSEQMLIDSTAYLEQKLSEKYPGIEFTLTSCVRRGLNQAYDEFGIAPKDHPELSAFARVWGDNGRFRLTDSFYGTLKSEDYEAMIQAKLVDLEPHAKVYSTLDYQFPEWFTLQTPIEEALKESAFFSYTWILLESDSRIFDDRADAIEALIHAEALAGDYTIYLLDDRCTPIQSKSDAFARIPAHSTDNPVYSRMKRFMQ